MRIPLTTKMCMPRHFPEIEERLGFMDVLGQL